MSKFKKMLKSGIMWILIIALLFSLYEIHPVFSTKGVLILSVYSNSSADMAGISNPQSAKYSDMERITEINDLMVRNQEDYYNIISGIQPNDTVIITTNLDTYYLTAREKTTLASFSTIEETQTIEETDPSTNITTNVTKTFTKEIPNYITNGTEDLGIVIMNVPSTNIKKGLDIVGGSRLLVKPAQEVDQETIDLIRNNLDQRLNGLGLKDVKVGVVNDLLNNRYIMITIAGKGDKDVLDLIQSQGKFEAKIGDVIVYSGDNNDVVDVCRTADCSYIEQCKKYSEEYVCRFRFALTLTDRAANRFGEVTSTLGVVSSDEYGNVLSVENRYLDKKLELFLDDKLIEALSIQASLKGNRFAKEVSITGSGTGKTSELARASALKEMLKLQTLLKTGSIPVKLEVVNYEEVSSVLGDKFLNNALLVGLLAIISVSLVVSIRYRSYVITLPIIFTMLSELVILLGVAVFMNWQLDLIAITAIIVAIGTGVDNQIVIVDESMSKHDIVQVGWTEILKRAFFIVFGSYLVVIVALIPLFWAGAGLLKGFALTTIAGVTIGVLITRQAFAKIIEVLLKED